MFYFGPWDQAGHYFFDVDGLRPHSSQIARCPWTENEIDGVLQPGCALTRGGYWTHTGPELEGKALVHYKDGWTALSFWDRSVDSRPASNSTYIVEGTVAFEQMVEFAKKSFAARWNKMSFEVTQA